MRTGKSLIELATELQRRATAKVDYLADTREVGFVAATGKAALVVNHQGYETTAVANDQIAERTGIPIKYFDRMLENAPALLEANVRHWFAEQPERRMVRTLDGKARAFLSDRYRRIDNEEVAEAVLPILLDSGDDIRIESADVTETRMYLKAVFPRLEGEVQPGDVVQSGVVISNSEIGLGAVSVQPLVFRLVCTNGMIARDAGLNRYHVGRRNGVGNQVELLLRDETKAADDRAFLMALQDVVKASLNRVQFDQLLHRLREATEGTRIQQPPKAVETLGKAFSLSEGERTSVLENLIRGRDYSRWGLLNAVTAVAENTASYDRATQLEETGGKILDLNVTDWRRIAEAV